MLCGKEATTVRISIPFRIKKRFFFPINNFFLLKMRRLEGCERQKQN